MVGRNAIRSACLGVLAAAACVGALAPATAAVAAAAPRCAQTAPQHVAAAAAFARGRYRLEAAGAAVRAALARVVGDRVLVAALAAGHLRAAGAEALRLVAAPGHITAISVRRGRRLLVDTQRYPFDVAGASATLGGHLGTVAVTVQDVIGFMRLVHEFTGSDVVAREAGGPARSTLAGALGVNLPTGGCVAIGGRSYAVRSFDETDFAGRALRISVLRDR